MSLRVRAIRCAALIGVLLPLVLTGCGFKPLYSKKSAENDISQVFGGVTIDAMSGKWGQQLREQLEDKLNPRGAIPPKPAYRLTVLFKHSIIPIGVARDNTVSRYNIYLTSKYVLYRTADNTPITSGTIGYVDSYNNLTNAYYSTYISEEDAFKNGIRELSELYRTRLSAYLNEGAPQQNNVVIPKEEETKSTDIPINPLLYSPDPASLPNASGGRTRAP